jgi:hypothetical protein
MNIPWSSMDGLSSWQALLLARIHAAIAGAGVPEEAQKTLAQGLFKALQPSLDHLEATPADARREPPGFPFQHLGQPHFKAADLPPQTLEGIHRLLGLELRLGADLLEALFMRVDDVVYQPLLVEQCTRIGQLYAELKRRSWAWFALKTLDWELRLLRYRASSAVADLLFPPAREESKGGASGTNLAPSSAAGPGQWT